MILELSRNKFDGHIPRQICQLKYLYLLDLSSNTLSGIIPRCLEQLHTMSGVEEAPRFTYGPYADYRIHGRLVLRGMSYETWLFAGNNFTGAIPRDIGNLPTLEFLDLSRNKLSCSIPPREIPSGPRFSTFDNSSYAGNPNLCGSPLIRGCSDHLHEDMTHCNNDNKQEIQLVQHEENNWLEEFSFYISMGIGFNTGFWVFFATLMLKKSWRYAYMRFLDNMGNKIYVFAAIRLNKIKQHSPN
ncbi:hypothetical protein HAX54_010557 [Datura stramonium]|uniref:Uncharacterized protein n=1 Tax=Datura stramonium TaxID=4076 RepID=A0ABS8WYK8_DATST|nr:hypothetical protein [Datura stramonium]